MLNIKKIRYKVPKSIAKCGALWQKNKPYQKGAKHRNLKTIKMGQSLVKNYIHITFSTKNRNNLITEDIEEELYNYIGGICKNLKCNPLKIGGYKNHVHILCLLHKNVALSNLIEK